MIKSSRAEHVRACVSSADALHPVAASSRPIDVEQPCIYVKRKDSPKNGQRFRDRCGGEFGFEARLRKRPHVVACGYSEVPAFEMRRDVILD
jgi:hypothetical protein